MRFHFRDGITNHQYIQPEQREQARAYRRAPTPAEAAAWELLRARRMLGLKFRRQQVIDGFIVDFFCAEHRIVIEVDGAVHEDPEVAAYDRERAVILRCRKLRLVRVKNDDVTRGHLEELLRSLLPASPPLPTGEGEGGEV
jgi:type I restriction enzyme R subunit